MIRILVTGCAGFIGSNLVDRLLELNYKVIGIDNFNDYYDPQVKKNNLKKALLSNKFKLYKEDILNFKKVDQIFRNEKPEKVIHLAARAGVRPSLKKILLYSQVNILGTVNLLKLSADYNVDQFIFGSSSSIYGNTKKIPFSESSPCCNIISPYGASKRAAEFWVETFHKAYGLKSVILRFFTVYGPRGRPDMAPAIFTKAILSGKKIRQFGDGSSRRDFTFIDDIIEGILYSFKVKSNFEIVNLGNSKPVFLKTFIRLIEQVTNRKAKIILEKIKLGDVNQTWADISKAKKLMGWNPKIPIEKGIGIYLND